MDRKSRILINALNNGKDKIILDRLKIPSYESTKGTTVFERNLCLDSIVNCIEGKFSKLLHSKFLQTTNEQNRI